MAYKVWIVRMYVVRPAWRQWEPFVSIIEAEVWAISLEDAAREVWLDLKRDGDDGRLMRFEEADRI